VPDVLAVLLLLAVSYSSSGSREPATPATVEVKQPVVSRRTRSKASRKGWVTRKRKAIMAAHKHPMVLVES
jgi:hypothetical protein